MSEINEDEREEYIYLINKYRALFNKIYNKYPIIFELNIINKLNFNIINSINDIKNNANYIMYINEYNKKYITYNYSSISQLMRILIARDLNIDDKYNWKSNKFNNNIKLTINKIKSNI